MSLKPKTRAVRAAPAKPGAKPKQSRDPVRSKKRILDAAKGEFCQHGFSGARVERIAARSKSNLRMIYHYFDSKDGLYLAVLDAAYTQIRSREASLDLSRMDPEDGIKALIGFTFDFFAAHQDVLAIISTENVLKGRFLKKLTHVRAMTVPLVNTIQGLLERGLNDGLFRAGVDPVQFYVSLVALSQMHILHRHTLSIIFRVDLSDADWIAARRRHVEQTLLGSLTAGR